MSDRIDFGWITREVPLQPAGLFAHGEAAKMLARRLLAMSEEALARLKGVRGENMLALLGSPEDLPWVPGLIYLGLDPDLPGFLLPTLYRPDVSAAVLGGALGLLDLATPAALVHEPACRFSLSGARNVDADRLRAWRGCP